MARPTDFSEEIAERICEKLAMGVPMSVICADEDMPSYTTTWRWEQKYPEFRKASAHARMAGTHYMAGDCIRISDADDIETADKRVMIDTRLRLIGKWNAREYGDKVAHVGGGPDDPPIRHQVDLSGLSDEELEQLERIAGKLAPAGGDQGGEGAA